MEPHFPTGNNDDKIGQKTSDHLRLIGVEAFGRPTSYSPVADSIVRTRAYELRNKLTKFYGSEAPDAPIEIEIARGAYVPRFIRRHDPSLSYAVTNTAANPHVTHHVVTAPEFPYEPTPQNR